MKTRVWLLILALFAIAGYGISSVMFSELSHNMAASMGLSLDEVEVVKVGFMITQVLGYMCAPVLIRKLGTYPLLIAALLAQLCINSVLYWQVSQHWLFTLSWLCSGLALSTLLVVINVYLLQHFEQRWLPIIIATTLVFSTLIPMGAYPWLMAKCLEVFNWSFFCVVSAWLFFSALVIARIFPLPSVAILTKEKSRPSTYLILAIAISLVVFLLMRGSYYNWWQSALYSQLTVVGSALVLLAIFLLVKNRSMITASIELHSKLKTNVFMYNAFLAGFAVMASTALFGNFLKLAMHYNDLNAGYAQLPSFYAMLVGMLLSVAVFYFKPSLADAVVPFGVLMIMLSVYDFSLLPSNVSPESLTMPMLLRGFGVGLLNVSVTISVLMYFNADQRLEGICNFYLFRTMGGVIGGAFFSRVIQNQSAQASGEIGRTLDGTSNAFSAYEQLLSSAILTHGRLPSPSLGMSQISGIVKEQATTLALNNALLVFIISIFVLAPILLIGKKLAAKHSL
ncbi:MFS transporter [Vibrio sp. 404]|uniref:MFS transporter n=1 Tax=Vibrio marinisediminis TaxID=2758441 RepID=A0A7W2FN27_9VIBR|nr:MFS transporter [Vibrio marinisediminis]MBA5761115.1 MFS transporter [Vibrio marinisediminis]